VRFEPTVCNGFNAGFDGVGLEPSLELLSAPLDSPCLTGATGVLVRASGQAGTIGHYECAIQDDWSTGATMAGAAKYNRYVEVAGNAVRLSTRVGSPDPLLGVV